MTRKHEGNLMTDPRRRGGPTTMQPPQPFLSEDLQLEIIARTDDVVTLVCCAAASKTLRHAIILDPAFRRCLAVIRAAAKGGFNPALLADVSYRIRKHGNGRTNDLIAINTSPRHRIDSTHLVSFEPACSRDGILVLWRQRELETSWYWYGYDGVVHRVQLLVCDVFTGDIAARPPEIDARGDNGIADDVYQPALLIPEEGAGGSHSFKLLVMDRCLRIQTFSSQDDRERHYARPFCRSPIAQYISNQKVCSAPAAVIGSNVHWLCHLITRNPLINLAMVIFAVNADKTGHRDPTTGRLSYEFA